MKELNINQSQLVAITGINKGSVSLYLSGKVTPTTERKKEIATALGLSEEYFTEKDKTFLDFSNIKIQTLKVEEVAKIMGHNVDTVREGLQQQRYGWGYAVLKKSGQWRYFINAKKFAEIERIFD